MLFRSLEQKVDIERAREIIRRLRIDIEDAIGCRVFYEAGNTTEGTAAFEKGKARVPRLIRAAVLQRHLAPMIWTVRLGSGEHSAATLASCG